MRRPLVTLKVASSLDGRIATASGESQWITGEAARLEGHRLRASHDGVLVGVGTVLADNPKLTVRLTPAAARQPLRIVLDGLARTPAGAALVVSACAAAPVLMCVGPSAPEAARAALARPHVAVVEVPRAASGLDVSAVLDVLAERGLQSVLIEGGGQVAASFLRAGFVDRIEWFRAPMLLGQEGRPAIGPLALDALAAAPRLHRVAVSSLGHDLWERYERVEG